MGWPPQNACLVAAVPAAVQVISQVTLFITESLMTFIHSTRRSGVSTLGRLANHLAATVVVAVWSGSAAHAAPVLFTDEAAFTSAVASLGATMAQDGFEGLPTGFIDSPLERGDYVITVGNVNPSVKLFANVDPARSTAGDTVLIAPSFIQPITFEFDRAIRAFSVDIIDTIAFAPAFLTVDVNGRGRSAAYRLPDHARIDFLGVLDVEGFSSIALSTAFARRPSLTSSNITIDRLRYESVPEPATLTLLGLSLLGVTARMRARPLRG